MAKRRAKPTLPTVRVVIREGQLSPAQAAAFRALFDRLLAPCPAPGNEGAPPPGEEDGAK